MPLLSRQYNSVKPLSEGEADILRWAEEPGEEVGVETVMDRVVFALTTELRLEDLDRIAGWIPVARRLTVATALPFS